MANKQLSKFKKGQIVASNDWELPLWYCKEIELLFVFYKFF